MTATSQPHAFIAYQRQSDQKKRLTVVHNFSKKGHRSYKFPLSKTGKGKYKKVSVIFNSDKRKYGGTGKFENRHVKVQSKHIKLSLAPQSTVVIEEK